MKIGIPLFKENKLNPSLNMEIGEECWDLKKRDKIKKNKRLQLQGEIGGIWISYFTRKKNKK